MYGKPPDDEDIRHCIAMSLRCHALCLEAVKHCLEDGNGYAESHLLAVLRDCAELSQVTANCLLRGSHCYEIVCSACFEICEYCVEALGDAPGLERCVDSCLSCAGSCAELLQNYVPETQHGE